jgi:hypothetical protein
MCTCSENLWIKSKESVLMATPLLSQSLTKNPYQPQINTDSTDWRLSAQHDIYSKDSIRYLGVFDPTTTD